MSLLEIEELCVEFAGRRGSRRALDGVSLTIEAGEIVGMVGESGAGKSLTGQSVIGLLDPPAYVAGGEVRLEGRRISGLSESAMQSIRGRLIGMVFQDPLTALNPLLTIGDQLVETITTHLPLGRPQAEQRALQLMLETGIPSPEQRMRQYPHQFSGGMRQRIVIALALAAEPKLIIADEPTTALDVSVQAQILDLLRSLCRERGTAVLLVTHDIGVISEVADRVVVMYAGRIVETGPVREILSRPRHPYTAGLMNSIPVVGRDTSRLIQIPGAMPRLDAVPTGCSFHPRCGRATPICSEKRPALRAEKRGAAACFHPLHNHLQAGLESC